MFSGQRYNNCLGPAPAGGLDFGCLRVDFGPAGSLDRVEHRLDLVDESTSSS
jgi:hypothetical protein